MSILDWTQTTIYNKPALSYAAVSGITTPTPTSPDTGTDPVIDMILSSGSHVGRRPTVGVASAMPLIDQATNLSYGGMSVMQTALEQSKLTLEGTFDTPTTNVSGHQLPTIIAGSGQRFTWAEFIALCFEGRATSTVGHWIIQNPKWYRDPYGRRFDNPRIFDFSASLVEAVPGRNTFTMTLVV